MAIKTFTTGEVLTASDTNTYLANSGLVYITSGALSSTATQFVGCFTSTYTNYRIVVQEATLSAAADFCFQFLKSTTAQTTSNYYYAYTRLTTGGAGANSSANTAPVGRWGMGANGTPNLMTMTADVIYPQVAATTASVIASGSSFLTGPAYLSSDGMCVYNVNDSFDGIQFMGSGGQTIGGFATIYGYRKA
jgi:hypothetical protein